MNQKRQFVLSLEMPYDLICSFLFYQKLFQSLRQQFYNAGDNSTFEQNQAHKIRSIYGGTSTGLPKINCLPSFSHIQVTIQRHKPFFLTELYGHHLIEIANAIKLTPNLRNYIIALISSNFGYLLSPICKTHPLIKMLLNSIHLCVMFASLQIAAQHIEYRLTLCRFLLSRLAFRLSLGFFILFGGKYPLSEAALFSAAQQHQHEVLTAFLGCFKSELILICQILAALHQPLVLAHHIITQLFQIFLPSIQQVQLSLNCVLPLRLPSSFEICQLPPYTKASLVPVSHLETLIFVNILTLWMFDFVESIHIELSYKGGVVFVDEVFGQDLLCEFADVFDMQAVAGARPAKEELYGRVLGYQALTFNICSNLAMKTGLRWLLPFLAALALIANFYYVMLDVVEQMFRVLLAERSSGKRKSENEYQRIFYRHFGVLKIIEKYCYIGCSIIVNILDQSYGKQKFIGNIRSDCFYRSQQVGRRNNTYNNQSALQRIKQNFCACIVFKQQHSYEKSFQNYEFMMF